MRYLFIVVLFALLSGNVKAEAEKIVKFSIQYDLKCGSKTTKVKFIASIPSDLKNRQQVLQIQYSNPPLRVIKKNENTYAEFEILSPQTEERIIITGSIKLFRYDLSIAINNKIVVKDDSISDYIKDEKYIESSAFLINKTANELQGKDTLKTIRKFFDFVSTGLNYDGLNEDDIGALEALKRRKGDCTEYTDLFVALCRANGIAARSIEGYTTDWKATPKHNWAEVYFNKLGWVPFDLTPGNNSTFKYMDNRYLYLSNQRNDTVLKGHYYAYYSWGEKITVQSSFLIL